MRGWNIVTIKFRFRKFSKALRASIVVRLQWPLPAVIVLCKSTPAPAIGEERILNQGGRDYA
ncbi:MAG: hypothetical protein ACRD19_02470 [Terriglobia bacterium]